MLRDENYADGYDDAYFGRGMLPPMIGNGTTRAVYFAGYDAGLADWQTAADEYRAAQRN